MNFLMKEKGLRRTNRGHDGVSVRDELIFRLRHRPWRSDKGSSSCLPKEARIEYERQEKSVAGDLPNFLKFHGLESADPLCPTVRPPFNIFRGPSSELFGTFCVF